MEDTHAEVRALLALDAIPGIGLVRLRKLVDRFGSAVDALRASADAFESIAGPGTAAARADSQLRLRIDAGLAEAERLAIDVCTWSSADYPRALLNLADPPPVLFLRGRRELLGTDAVTIVGARHATARSRDVAHRLGQGLAAAGMTVVSGLALGVDAASHRGALAAHGATIAVLGRGADRAYPPGHRGLFRDIVEHGLVVSEFLPGTPALPHHFPRRNRILAGIAQAVVVVEASKSSGALITVDHALDLGVDVWAVPGPIDVPLCEGSNQLIADGAKPLVSIAGFVTSVTGIEPETRTRPPLEGAAGRVLESLGRDLLGVDQLAARARMQVAEALALLTELELRGLVRQEPGMRFRRVA